MTKENEKLLNMIRLIFSAYEKELESKDHWRKDLRAARHIAVEIFKEIGQEEYHGK